MALGLSVRFDPSTPLVNHKLALSTKPAAHENDDNELAPENPEPNRLKNVARLFGHDTLESARLFVHAL
jgi:hypothetical protein